MAERIATFAKRLVDLFGLEVPAVRGGDEVTIGEGVEESSRQALRPTLAAEPAAQRPVGDQLQLLLRLKESVFLDRGRVAEDVGGVAQASDRLADLRASRVRSITAAYKLSRQLPQQLMLQRFIERLDRGPDDVDLDTVEAPLSSSV